jgi:hypothetical protein
MNEPTKQDSRTRRKPLSMRAVAIVLTVWCLGFAGVFAYLKLTGRAHGRMASPAGWLDIGINVAGALFGVFVACKHTGRRASRGEKPSRPRPLIPSNATGTRQDPQNGTS